MPAWPLNGAVRVNSNGSEHCGQVGCTGLLGLRYSLAAVITLPHRGFDNAYLSVNSEAGSVRSGRRLKIFSPVLPLRSHSRHVPARYRVAGRARLSRKTGQSLFPLRLRLLLLLGDLVGRLWRRPGAGSAIHILGLCKSFGGQLFKLCTGH